MHENTVADTSFKTYTDITTTKVFMLPGLETCLNFTSGKKNLGGILLIKVLEHKFRKQIHMPSLSVSFMKSKKFSTP